MANEEVLELQIHDNASVAASGLLALSGALTKVKEAVGKGMNLKGTVSGLEKLKNAINTGLNEDSVARFERLASVLERLKGMGQLKITGIKNIANQMNVADSLTEAKEQAQDAANSIAGAVDRGMEEVESRTGEVANNVKSNFSGIKSWFKDVADGFRGIKEEGKDTSGTWGFFNSLGEGIRNARGHISGLLGDFTRIVKYRMIRSVIKQITEAFTTGIKNVYFYSKAIGGSFAPAMDDAASVLLQFKNSIGAAAAPLIQSLIPYLKIVVNYAIEAINFINQLIALLRGQSTWTKAIYKNTDAFEDKTKKAKKAGKAIKDLLADWDELNIIQSESGGGAGGSAAKAAEDYTKMFEEESKFNSWLKDNLSDLRDMLVLAGAAIAGWKFSKVFTGVLNKLGRLIAGGALVALGLKLSFESGFDAGANGFNTTNILGMIGGALAAGLGGYLITSTIGLGGGVGLAIGLGVAVVASLVGYIKGKQDLADKNKWGNMNWTRQQIEDFVHSQFTFDAVAEIEIFDGVIKNEQTARENLDQKITDFKESLQEATIQASINIDSDKASQSIKDAAIQGQAAIKAVNELVNASGEGLNVILKSFSFTNEAGEDISKELLSSVSIADKTLTDYFMGIGDELAALIEKGESEHWKNADTKKAALELMAYEQEILNEKNRLQPEIQLDTQITAGMSKVVDRDTAKTILEEQKQELEDYKAKAQELFDEQSATWSELAALALAASEKAFEKGDEANGQALYESYETYRQKAIDILSESEDAINAKLDETKANMAKAWAETLQTVYGADFQSKLNDYYNKYSRTTGLNEASDMQLAARTGDTSKAAELLKKYLIDSFTEADPNGIVTYVLNDLQGNVFDLLTDEMKKQIYKNLMSVTDDNDHIVREIFKDAFGITDEDFNDFFRIPSDGLLEEWNGILEEVDLDANATVHLEADAEKFKQDLRNELDYAISDKVITADEEEALRKRFSDTLYEQMLEEMGIKTDKYGNVSGRLGVRTLANAGGYSDVGYTPRQIDNEENEKQANDQMVTNMTNSMKSANEPQNELLRSMILQLTNLNNKQWNINITPDSRWGQHNAQSNEAYSMVTGEVYNG